MFPVPGRVLSAVYALIHNPAPTPFANEEIHLKRVKYLAPGHGAFSWYRLESNRVRRAPGFALHHCPPLPSDVPREAAAAQRGQGLAQGHPAVNLLPPRPELLPWTQANWPHFLEGAGGTHLLQPDSPRATQLPLLSLLLEKVSPEHREQLCAGPKGTPGNPPSPPFCAKRQWTQYSTRTR